MMTVILFREKRVPLSVVMDVQYLCDGEKRDVRMIKRPVDGYEVFLLRERMMVVTIRET